jgi:guanylate kinase
MSTTVDIGQSPATKASGQLFVVSAPSGAGKTTLCNAVRSRFGDLAYSVSYTTRPPRPGEQHGVDYYFISLNEFEKGIADNRWAEWARVHDNLYGTSSQWITETLSRGKDILMDIDVQGAEQILRRFPDAITIFIRPPSLEALKNRLYQRGTDKEETIALRMANAKAEMAAETMYRYVVINDDLERAKKQIIQLIDRCRS